MRRIRQVAWAAALTLGAAQAWATRHAMNPDGMSYLDIGDAYARGDWANAVTGYFSPMYSWVTGAALAALRPSAGWEFAVVHLVNVALFAFALACFEFFLRSFLRAYRVSGERIPAALVSDRAWMVVGYALFTWTSLSLVTATIVTPDMLLSAWAYLAAGLLLRIRVGDRRAVTFAALGAVLGAGYLTKGAMLPLAAVFLTAAALAVGSVRAAASRVAVAAAALVVVAGPFVAALSTVKHRFTVGDTAKLNYAWYVNGVPLFVHWQGGPPGNGSPRHPPRLLSRSPTVYEFRSPLPATYPLWYDASYWHEGLTLRFDPVTQLKRLLGYSGAYLTLFAPILIGVLAHVYAAGRRGLTRAATADVMPVVLSGLAAFVMYGLVYMESRFLAAFAVLLCLGAMAAARWPAAGVAPRVAGAAPVAIATVLVVGFGYRLLSDGPPALRGLRHPTSGNDYALVAGELRAHGLRPGDPVGVIGDGLVAYWARLGRLRLVTELPAADAAQFWAADDSLRTRVLATMANAGARAIVAQEVPGWARTGGWQRLGAPGFAVWTALAPRGASTNSAGAGDGH